MDNELKEILKRIKFLSDKNISQIAIELGFKSRAYFNDQVNKGDNEEIKNKMLAYEEKIKQKVSEEKKAQLANYIITPTTATMDTVDYKKKYIEQLENNNAFLSGQVKANHTIVDEKEQRIKSLEDVVSSLTAQIAEKNEIIGRLKIMDTNLNAVLKTLSTRQTKQAAS